MSAFPSPLTHFQPRASVFLLCCHLFIYLLIHLFIHARRISTSSQICSFAERRPFKNGSKASALTPRCDATCCSNNCLGNSHSLYSMNCYFTTLICINADLPESKEQSWHYTNVFYSNTVEMQFLQILRLQFIAFHEGKKISEALEVADKTLSIISIPDRSSEQRHGGQTGKTMTMTEAHTCVSAVNDRRRHCAKPKCHTSTTRVARNRKVKFKVKSLKSSCCENAAGGFFLLFFFYLFHLPAIVRPLVAPKEEIR